MTQKSALGGSVARLSVNEDFPTRPAYGTRGKPITLWANYFNLQPAKNLVLYRYHVSVSPEAKGKKLKRIFDLLIHEPSLAGAVTDFKTLLILSKKVEEMVLEIAYRSEFEDDPQPNTRPYRVNIQITGQIEVAALLNHINTTQADPNFSPPTQMQIIQTLNILLGHYPQANPATSSIGGNKHFSFGVKPVGFDLGGGLAALRGYFRSVRLSTGRMLVNINVNHAVFFQPGSLVDLINTFANAYGRNPWQLEKFLKKVRVETTHLPVKKNKAGQKIPRIKTIIALANTNDGSVLPHPPRVSKFAAGPKDVQFWLDDSSQNTSTKPGSKKVKASMKPTAASYITVYDFFQKCKQRLLFPLDSKTNSD
jgi:eukaryotic translation initiation factor 2C